MSPNTFDTTQTTDTRVTQMVGRPLYNTSGVFNPDVVPTQTADERWAADTGYILDWFRTTPLGHDRIFAEGKKYSALYDEYNTKLESENPKWCGQPLSAEYIALCNKEYLDKCIYHQNMMAAMKLKLKRDKRSK